MPWAKPIEITLADRVWCCGFRVGEHNLPVTHFRIEGGVTGPDYVTITLTCVEPPEFEPYVLEGVLIDKAQYEDYQRLCRERLDRERQERRA